MLSNVIVDTIDTAIADLTKKTNLFAEQGQGDKYVVVSTTTTISPIIDIDVLRESPMNVLVAGWNALEGSRLAESISATVKAMLGTYTYTGSVGVTETYKIKSVIVQNWPTLTQAIPKAIFSSNFIFTYTKS